MAETGRPLFSIGAVARMLELSPATIRTWETRYGLVTPGRTEGGQRLYSRDHVEQLRFVKGEIEAGRRPGEAHRLLAERLGRGDRFGEDRIRVLVADGRRGAARALRELLGTEAFELVLVEDPDAAARAFDELSPELVVVDTGDPGFHALAERSRAAGRKVLPMELVERPLARLDEARALLNG